MKKNTILNLLIILVFVNLIFIPMLVFASAAEKLPEPTNIYTNPNGNTSGTAANDGWYNKKVERSGATTIYHGEKKQGDKIYTGRSQTRPGVSAMTKKVIRMGVAGAVLDALDILLDGVDYVMYEENNRVKFRTNEPVICYMMGSPCFSTIEEAEEYVRKYYDEFWQGKPYHLQLIRKANGDVDFVAIGKYSDGRDDVRTMPYHWKNKVATAEEVAEQILKDAEKGKAPAVETVGQVADEITPQFKKNEDYEASKMIRPEPNPSTNPSTNPNTNPSTDPSTNPNTNPSTNPNNEPEPNENPKNEPQDKELPAFCGWASVVCEFVDWAKNESKDKEEPTRLDFPDSNISKPNTNIKFNSYCPQPKIVPYSIAGAKGQLVFSFDYICQICSMLKPIVIAVATFIAAMIVTGTATRGN